MKQVASALVKAQKEFGPALKAGTNLHFGSRYAKLDACIEAVIDALNNNGIMLTQCVSECSDGVIVETVFLHESGEEWRCGKLHVPAIKQDPQAYCSALTYARRYSLMAASGIAPEDDDGNAASKRPPAKAAETETPPEFDIEAACTWIREGSTLEEQKQRGRQCYTQAATDAQKQRIQALVADLERAALSGV